MRISWPIIVALILLTICGCSVNEALKESITTTTTSSTTTSSTTTSSTTTTSTSTSTSSTTTTTLQPNFPKKFSIEGNKIVDDKGVEHVFRGVNVLDPGWMDAIYYNLNDAYFSQLAAWNVKIIRIPVHPAAYKYYGQEIYFKLLDKMIGLAAKHEIYSIIDFHSIGFPPDQSSMYLEGVNTPWTGSIYNYSENDLESFWDAASKHYKDDDRVVFYELFNEPTSGVGGIALSSWLAWKAEAEKLIDIIRANDPDSKIIVGGLGYSYDISFAYDNPIARANIVYGTHPYPNQEKSNYDAFIKVREKYPVFATEFGFDSDAIGKHYQADAQYAADLVSTLESNKISWTVWHFSPDWAPALIQDWDYMPTISGTTFKALLNFYLNF